MRTACDTGAGRDARPCAQGPTGQAYHATGAQPTGVKQTTVHHTTTHHVGGAQGAPLGGQHAVKDYNAQVRPAPHYRMELHCWRIPREVQDCNPQVAV